MTQPNDPPLIRYRLDALVAALAALDRANATAQAALEDLGLPGPSREALAAAFGSQWPPAERGEATERST